MLYSKDISKTYANGIQSTGCVSLAELPGKLGEETLFLNITCYGRKYSGDEWVHDFTAEYYVPMDKFKQLGHNKKITSVDVLNPGREKKGTLTLVGKHYSLLTQWGQLAISSDVKVSDLHEAIADKVFLSMAVLIKEAITPQHEHVWEVKTGVYSPLQTDPTSIYTCSKCGVQYVTIAADATLPSRGCTAGSA